MKIKKIILAIAILITLSVPMLSSEDYDAEKNQIDAKSAYYDGMGFVLTFDQGLVGYYDIIILDSDGNVFFKADDFKFDDKDKIRFRPQNGKEVHSGLYTVDMLGSNSYIHEIIHVSLKITSIELNEHNLILERGDSFKLNATFSPVDAVDKEIHWKSNNPDVASVNEDGYVIAKAGGEAVITAESVDGIKDQCVVKVNGKAPLDLESIIVSGDYKTDYLYGQHLDKSGLVVMATYSDGSNKDVTVDSIFSPEIFLESGDISIKVVYGTATTHFSVTVSGGPVNPDHGEDGGDNVSLPILVCVALAIIGAVGLFFMIRRRP